jgi:hypothetical protein
MRFRAIVAIAVFALFAAACSSTDSTSSTASPTTAAAPTTAPDLSTTTTTAAATTTTQAAPTTAAATPTPGDAQEIVDAKVLAFSEAAPDDWDVSEQADDDFDEGEFTYVSCLGADDFDLDELDEATLVVREMRASASAGAIPFGSTSGILEARVFESEQTAASVFAVIERIYGTDEGRQCMADVIAQELGQDASAEFGEVTVEEYLVEGADVGARTTLTAVSEGVSFSFTIDLVAHRDGACTVVATFISFGEPFPTNVADDLFSAAVNA